MKHLRAQMYIRWLNAFRGHEFTINESIKFELKRSGDAACEPIWFGENTSQIRTYVPGAYSPYNSYGIGNVTVGLLIKKTHVFKVLPFDCWSYYGKAENGQDPTRLYYGRKSSDKKNNHAEAWYKTSPDDSAIAGIIVYDFSNQSESFKQKIRAIARNNKLKVYSQNGTNKIKEAYNPQ